MFYHYYKYKEKVTKNRVVVDINQQMNLMIDEQNSLAISASISICILKGLFIEPRNLHLIDLEEFQK